MNKINPLLHEEISLSELRINANNVLNKIVIINDNTYLITELNTSMKSIDVEITLTGEILTVTATVDYELTRVEIEEATVEKEVKDTKIIEDDEPTSKFELMDIE